MVTGVFGGRDTAMTAVLLGIVTDTPALDAAGPRLKRCIAGDLRNINAAFLQKERVGQVICPLFAPPDSPQHDAISVIEVLAEIGYRGEIVVLAPPLLRPKMVETELRDLARGMKLRFLAGVLPPLSEI